MRHYTPFVKELRDRVRSILDTGTGIEETAKMTSKPLQNANREPSYPRKLKSDENIFGRNVLRRRRARKSNAFSGGV